MFQPLEATSRELSPQLSAWYSQALTLSAQLGDFLSGDPLALEPQVRQFEVWRKPIPDLQTPEVCNSAVSETNTGQSIV